MKRYIKGTLALAMGVIGMLSAQAENIVLTTPPNFQVFSVSPNGKWAAGVFMDTGGEIYGFRWNLESGSITVLGGDPNFAWDVANDGTVSGDFYDDKAYKNGSTADLPGYWRDGRWHHLQMPEGRVTDGIGFGISPDGRFMTGSVNLNGTYTSYIWKDGQIYRSLATDNHNVAYAVAPDGSAAAGYNTQYNRTACIWTADGELVHLEDANTVSQSPWNYSRNFSPDGTKMVYWGGWHIEDENQYLYCLYDVLTGERSRVMVDSQYSTMEFNDVSNSGLLVGNEYDRGYVVKDGQGMFIDEYLQSRGVDLTNYEHFYNSGDFYANQLPISNVVSVSEDDNVLAMNYYDKTGLQRSLVVKFDQDASATKPAEVEARQMSGINSVAVTWKKPVGNSPVRGYNVYRDGRKLNGLLPINVPYYYDNNVADGEHTYEVSAVTVSGTENRAASITVNVVPKANEAPYGLLSRQKGVNSAYLSWRAPLSNIVHKNYYASADDKVAPFYIYDALDIELALSFAAEEMKSYAGYRVSEVSFVPMARHDGWFVNLYTRDSDGALVRLYRQQVTQELNPGTLNTVKLTETVSVPNGELLVSVECRTNGYNYETLGTYKNAITPGRTDLLRMVDVDDDFFSAYDASMENGQIVCSTWAIDLGLVNENTGADSNITYRVYSDDQLVAETDDTGIVLDNLDDGVYTFEIEAVYDNGTVSERRHADVEIQGNYPVIKSVDVQNVDSRTIRACWQAPVDDDRTEFAYTTATRPANGIVTNTEYFMAAVDYPNTSLRSFDGYVIDSFRFYPMSEATYYCVLYDNDEMVCAFEAKDYQLNAWNECRLPEQIYIRDGHNYRVAIECTDYNPADKLIGLDSNPGIEFVSDLYSTDGDYFSSLATDAGIYANWMIGMCLVSTDTREITTDGYDVVIDGKKVNDSKVTTTEYEHSYSNTDARRHNIHVDVYYPVKTEALTGERTYFYLSAAGITDGMVGDITLRTGDNYLKVEAENVKTIDIYSTAGIKVASAQGDQVSIGHLHRGVYVVNINLGDKTVSRKIHITK